MLHLESYKRYSQRDFSFDDAIDYIDQGIRRFTGGAFKVRIEIERDSQNIQNFPHENVPDFLAKWDYPTKKDDDPFKYMYSLWRIKFDYFWQHDQKVGNQSLAKKMFSKMKELPQEYWADTHITMGLKSIGNESYAKQSGNWLDVFVEPLPLYTILDKYFERDVNASARKAWTGNITYPDMNALVNEIEPDIFDPEVINFYK